MAISPSASSRSNGGGSEVSAERGESRRKPRVNSHLDRKKRRAPDSSSSESSESDSDMSSKGEGDRLRHRRRKRKRSRSNSEDATSSSEYGSDEHERKRRRKGKTKKEKKVKERRHRHNKDRKRKDKEKSKRGDGSPVQLSKLLRRDKEEGFRRSVISGKKIQLRIEKTQEDKRAENNRKELLRFLNASYD